MSRQRRLTGPLAMLGALIALVILLFPLYAVIVASFENNSQLLGTRYNFLPPTPASPTTAPSSRLRAATSPAP